MYPAGEKNPYQNTQVSTASGAKLVLMMYDGAIRFITEAKTEIKRKNISATGIRIRKAQGIVSELMGSLNHEKGKDVAKGLEKVYIEVNKVLTEANINGELKPLEDAIMMLENLRSAWLKVLSGEVPVDEPTLQKSAPATVSRLAISI